MAHANDNDVPTILANYRANVRQLGFRNASRDSYSLTQLWRTEPNLSRTTRLSPEKTIVLIAPAIGELFDGCPFLRVSKLRSSRPCELPFRQDKLRIRLISADGAIKRKDSRLALASFLFNYNRGYFFGREEGGGERIRGKCERGRRAPVKTNQRSLLSQTAGGWLERL